MYAVSLHEFLSIFEYKILIKRYTDRLIKILLLLYVVYVYIVTLVEFIDAGFS